MTALHLLFPWGTATAAAFPDRPPTPRHAALWRHLAERIALYNLDPEVLHLAWELSSWQSGLSPAEDEALFLLVLIALINFRQGSTRLPIGPDAGEQPVEAMLPNLVLGSESLTRPADLLRLLEEGRADGIIGAEEDYKPLLYLRPHLYLQKIFQLERGFAGRYAELRNRRVPEADSQQIENCLQEVFTNPARRNEQAITLTTEQQEAVRRAVRAPLTVISGGPGTGKTTIVVSILRVLRRLGVTMDQVALAAPTGKGAKRMGEAIAQGLEGLTTPVDQLVLPEPRTLHRLLGYSPATGRFRHHENNRLSERVVIVDEASMIDLTLMERLVRSVRDDARFILLGDAEQLPSVEAGAVLRDLVPAAGPLPAEVLLLRKSHRMSPSDPAGRNILLVAGRINRGEVAGLLKSRSQDDAITERRSAAQLAWQGVEYISSDKDPREVDGLLERWYTEHIRGMPGFMDRIQQVYHQRADGFPPEDAAGLTALFTHFDRFRLLCMTRVYRTGTHSINELLHARLARDLGTARTSSFVTGEPVLMQVNDYGKGLFNGDQGVILSVIEGRHAPQLMAVFRRGEHFAAFHLDTLRVHLERAFAMTVHKSQGSEFDHVGIILPEQDLPINSREILYTAVTRSRKSVTIVGKREILEKGVQRRVRRYSGIG